MVRHYNGLNIITDGFDLYKEFEVGQIKYKIIRYASGYIKVFKKVGDIVTWSTISSQALRDDECYNFWIKGVVNGEVH